MENIWLKSDLTKAFIGFILLSALLGISLLLERLVA